LKSGGKVIVGLDDSFVPMGFRERDGKLVGYDIDLAKAVFKQYGIKVDFQTIDWSMKETELKNGTIDLIWNGYSMTPGTGQASSLFQALPLKPPGTGHQEKGPH
jgi:ABC-type amino acid transport substrate-binding protein